MARRISWPELSRSAEYQGLWVALDNCRYDPASMEPVEGDVVDVDEDIAVLCDRLRGLHRKACSILFCDGDVMVESRPGGRRSDPGARSTL